MKHAIGMTCLLAALAISARAVPPIAVTSLTVTGADNADGSNVTVVADIGIYVLDDGGQVMLRVTSTNGLVGQLFQPELLTFTPFHIAKGGLPKIVRGVCTWTNMAWNPYFTGDYVVTVFATDLANGYTDALSTTVTVARTFGGTMNSAKVQSDPGTLAYDPAGVWENIDLNRVLVHNIQITDTNIGSVSIGCNLMNNPTNVTITTNMSAEDMDKAYMDTGLYRTNGTPFRFDMDLHARPTSMMGFGEIKRFVWTPTVATNPAGSGNLIADVISCQPWRSGYTNNFLAHVGCAPMFVADTHEAVWMEGMIMSTTAHYMDVGPEVDDIGIGLRVNGQSNTTSYLKSFVSDTMLASWGIPVDRAPEVLAGYVTHFTSNSVSEGDTTAVTTEFSRIAGGTNIVYAYTSSTNGDSGYEARLTFTFHSPVAAQIGLIANPVLTGDIDGDGLADLITVMDSNWYVWFSSSGYTQHIGPIDLGVAGMPAAGDIDGDRLADLILVVGSNWYVWFSSSGYAQHIGPIDLGIPGKPVTGDIDGDRLADLIMVAGANWYVWFSSSGYAQRIGPIDLGIAGKPAAGDIDGDGRADLIMVVGSNWYVWFSSSSYAQRIGPIDLGVSGTPTTGDIGGDGLADLMTVVESNWLVWLSSSGYTQRIGPYPLIP